ncbi:unnamed protein product [Protopolystoma xenopodis]|uniref:Uncharacterized protein n=1 Tax=Protopolystoma xenopodis TaxID=117903 RepID=A0A448WHN9_9PLAT|nr:unnamed protein product [Protopolystoma xenopodis]
MPFRFGSVTLTADPLQIGGFGGRAGPRKKSDRDRQHCVRADQQISHHSEAASLEAAQDAISGPVTTGQFSCSSSSSACSSICRVLLTGQLWLDGKTGVKRVWKRRDNFEQKEDTLFIIEAFLPRKSGHRVAAIMWRED